jgi:signal peptidase II
MKVNYKGCLRIFEVESPSACSSTARNLRVFVSGSSYIEDRISSETTRSVLMIWVEWIMTAVLVVTADQLSKAFVLARWPLAASSTRGSFVSIRCILNRRGTLAAFIGEPALMVLWALLVMLAALIQHYGLLGDAAIGAIGIGAAIGGATGNMLDRVLRGAIVDFVAIGPWPVFNLADAALVAGAGLILLTVLGGHA